MNTETNMPLPLPDFRYQRSRHKNQEGQYDPSFMDYVAAHCQCGTSPENAADQLNLPVLLVRYWARRREPTERADDLEMKLLRRDLETIEHERDVLKEAATFISDGLPAGTQMQLVREELQYAGRQRDAYLGAIRLLSADPSLSAAAPKKTVAGGPDAV
jgi:hypothetical protein